MNSEKLLAEAKEVVRDLSVRELIEASIRNGEGTFSDRGACVLRRVPIRDGPRKISSLSIRP